MSRDKWRIAAAQKQQVKKSHLMFKDSVIFNSNNEATPLEKAAAILLCEDLGSPGSGMDIKEVGSLLEDSFTDTSVEIFPDEVIARMFALRALGGRLNDGNLD